MKTFIRSALAACFLIGGQMAVAGPVVVELFTSQGCSSCPPADALLGELARDPAIIALTFPVDYWDYLGWKDTLALPAFTKRQRNYAVKRGSGSVFTPEMIVDGTNSLVGSRRKEVFDMISVRVNSTAPLLDVRREGKMVRISLPGSRKADADILALDVRPHVAVAVGRGENAGRNLDLWNVVRNLDLVGHWSGESTTIALADTKPDDALVILVQDNSNGAILGAAWLSPF